MKENPRKGAGTFLVQPPICFQHSLYTIPSIWSLSICSNPHLDDKQTVPLNHWIVLLLFDILISCCNLPVYNSNHRILIPFFGSDTNLSINLSRPQYVIVHTHKYTNRHTHIYPRIHVYKHTYTYIHLFTQRGKCQPTPVFLPGKSHGQRSLMATVHEVAVSQT